MDSVAVRHISVDVFTVSWDALLVGLYLCLLCSLHHIGFQLRAFYIIYVNVIYVIYICVCVCANQPTCDN